MKCSIQGRPGHYRKQTIFYTLRCEGEVRVFENVSAEVCDVCSDTLLKPQTIQHIETMLQQNTKPSKLAPVYDYA